MAGGYEIGLSQSQATSQRAGGGQWNINEGGGKQTEVLIIMVSVVAVAGFLIFLLFRRPRR